MDRHYSIPALLKYTVPTMAMMIFTSIYGVVDGFFVSNYAGKTAFASVNLILPFVMALSTVGFMLGTGGSAIIAKTRGEGDNDRANRYFSLVVVFGAAVALVMAVIGTFSMPAVAAFLGAEESMMGDSVLYGRLSMISLVPFVLQVMFQVLFTTAGKPQYGLRVILVAGCVNMLLDYVFIGVLGWGVAGAALATNASEYIGGLVPVWYFLRKGNSSFLRLCSPFVRREDGSRGVEWRVVGKICGNGSSEMVGELSISIVSMVYNFQLITMVGENGVAAFGVIMYAEFIFSGILYGYSVGAAPLMSYQYGAQNRLEMRSLLKNGIIVLVVAGLLMFAAAQLCAGIVADIFTSYDQELRELTVHGFRLYAISYIIMGVNLYAASLFTALNNGLVSALIAFIRTMVCEIIAVIVLPLVLGVDGIWLSITAAEICAFAVSLLFFLKYRRRYFGLELDAESNAGKDSSR